MTLQRYFADELSYLRDLGDEFSRENPNLAAFLSRQSSDPDVERLLEAFAFLSARLRQKLDDELPELSHSMVQVLWPHYLRPTPACAIVEFTTAGPQIVLPKGTQVQARPIDGTRCTFQTSFDNTVRPLRVTDVETEASPGGGMMRLRIVNTFGQTCERLSLDHLHLHLAAEREPQVARMLYQWLRVHLTEIGVEARGVTARLPASIVVPVGFGGDQDLLPYPPTSFEGFRHIQEYFAYPEKFMFLDITDLACLRGAPVSEFTLVLRFKQAMPDRLRITPAHIRLNSVPVVNLFPHDAQPLNVDHARSEYRVQPSGANVDHYGIFSIDRVTGWARARNERTVYEPFESFRNTSVKSASFYHARIKPAVARGQPETYISFVNGEGEGLLPASEVVGLMLTCTNGRLAEYVVPGSIDQVTAATPGPVTFRNITPVSREIPPPIHGNLLWRLIANLSRNYGSIADIAALRMVVGTYDLAAAFDQQARRRLDLLLEGLQSTQLEPLEWIERGVPVRGQRIRLTVTESKLGGEYESYLLGSVLDSFFGSYAAINSCHQLVLDGDETKLQFTWPVRFGNRPSL